MFSTLNRMRADVFVRVVVLVLAAAVICISFAPSVLARDPGDSGPFIHPGAGDGDDVTGIRDPNFRDEPADEVFAPERVENRSPGKTIQISTLLDLWYTFFWALIKPGV